MLKKKPFLFILVTLLFFSSNSLNVTAANLSDGVYHSKDSVTAGGHIQSVNQLSINLNKPNTTINLGISSPLNRLATVSSLAKLHTQNQNHVVGAINASFFHFANGYPGYLLIDNGIIKHLGVVSTNYNDYMHTPAAFGINSDNTAKVGKYDLAVQIEHDGKTFNTTSLNRERSVNESIFYTSSYSYERTRTNNTGWEVVVETPNSVEQNIALGQKITGKVSAIRTRGGHVTSASIPQNGRGFVLSATDEEIYKIIDMKIGDTVSVSYNVDESWKDAKFMLASGPLLVQNGKVNMTIDPNSSNARQRTARTAAATDASGKRAFFVTVDTNRNGKTGMTLNEFANHLVKIGAYNAINLDGGGSTTMVTRKPGQIYPTLANQPSDGSERRVSAILEAVATAPNNKPYLVKASQTENGIIAIGASVGFKVDSVVSENNTTLEIDQTKLQLTSVTNSVGKIEGNKFFGTKAGAGTVNANYDGVSVSIPVTVTDTIDDLAFIPSIIRVGTGEKAELNVKGIINNKQVIFNPDVIELSVPSNVGRIEGKTFIAGDNEVSGTLTATFGKTKKNISVHVSDKPLYLGSFESTSGLQATTARAKASLAVENKIQPIHMNNSIKLNYDFTANKEGVSAAYMTWTNGLPLAGQPKKIGVWVYGDGKNHWLRSSLTDANKKEVVVDFTKEGGLNWTGWKYVEATIPQTAAAPLTLNRLYVAETSSTKKDKGFLLFDKIQAHYSNKQHIEQAFVPSSSAREVPTNKKFTVTFTQPMKTTFFTDQYIYVEDVNGLRQPVTVSKTNDTKKVEVSAPKNGYTAGQHYRLVITHFAQNNQNISMVKDNITEFKVQ